MDLIRQQLAFLLMPLIKSKVVSKHHYQAALAGYEIVQTGPRSYTYRKIKWSDVAVLYLPSIEGIMIDNANEKA